MNAPVSDLQVLLRTLEPVLHDGVFVYAMIPPDSGTDHIQSIATFREAEGVTIIAAEHDALAANLPVLFRAAWITLNVHSDLQAVGLTAAVSHALTEAGISCNVVAAACHDHIFVPVERAGEAMQRLWALQHSANQPA